MAKEDEMPPREKKERRKKSKSAVAAVLDSEEAGGRQPVAKKGTSFSFFPIPRKILLDPEQADRYLRENGLAFVNGSDRRFTNQNVEFGNLHPDLGRPFDPDAEPGTVLPNSWPPNVTLQNPDSPDAVWYPGPVHGGLRWTGSPKPRYQSKENFKKSLPGFLQRFLS